MDLHLLVLERNMGGVSKRLRDVELLHGELDILASQIVPLGVPHQFLGFLDYLVHLVVK